MGRIPGAPTLDASFQLSCLCRDIEETGRGLGGFFWGDLGRATPGQHSRGLHSPSSVFGYHLTKDSQCSGQKQNNFPKRGQGGIPGFNGILC